MPALPTGTYRPVAPLLGSRLRQTTIPMQQPLLISRLCPPARFPTRSPPRPAVAAQPAALRRRRLLKPRRQGPSKGWPGSRAIVHRSVHQLHDNGRNGLLYRFPVHRGFGSRRRRRRVHGRHGVNRRRRRRGRFGGGRRVLPLKQSNGGYLAADPITTVIQIQSSRMLGRRARSEMK